MSSVFTKTRGWKLPLIAAAGIVFGIITVMGKKETPIPEPIMAPPASPFANHIAGIGVIEPKSELVAIGTELSGIAREIHVKVGDKVTRGAPLFTLDNRATLAEIATLRASLATARVGAADAAAQFATISRVRDTRAVSRDEVNTRRFARDSANARVAEITAQLAQAQTTLSRLTMRAPMDGEILELNIRSGEFASNSPTNGLPLIRMGDTSTLYVRVEIDEENAARVTQSATANALRRGDTTKPYPLTFVRFEPFVKAKQNLAISGQRVDTRVLQILYALPQNSTDIFIGGQMDVFIKDAAQTNEPLPAPASAETPEAEQP